jgi:hypothetical protein
VADPETRQMPGGKMVEPPKGKKKAAQAEMPSGAMHEPPAKTSARKKGGKKK